MVSACGSTAVVTAQAPTDAEHNRPGADSTTTSPVIPAASIDSSSGVPHRRTELMATKFVDPPATLREYTGDIQLREAEGLWHSLPQRGDERNRAKQTVFEEVVHDGNRTPRSMPTLVSSSHLFDT